MMKADPPIAVASPPARGPQAVDVRVNFGVVAGREATPAEIDDLARVLLPIAEPVSIVAEQRHEIGDGREAVVHQVRITIDDEAVTGNADELRGRVLEAASRWAEDCASVRHAAV